MITDTRQAPSTDRHTGEFRAPSALTANTLATATTLATANTAAEQAPEELGDPHFRHRQPPPLWRQISGVSRGRWVLRIVVVVLLLAGSAVAAASLGVDGISTVVPFIGTGPGTAHAGGANSVVQPGGKTGTLPGTQPGVISSMGTVNGSPSPGASPSPGTSASTGTGQQPPTSPTLPPGAPVPTGTTLCGASFAQINGQSYMQALSYEEGIIGQMHAVRVFYPGAPAAWPGNAGNVDRTVIVSFKYSPSQITSGAEDSYMQSWFNNAPRDREIYWVYYHEPEDDIEGGAFTAAEYRAAWTHLAGLARKANNSHLHATLVLMNWTLNSGSHRTWTDYYAGNNVIDVLGWDVYNLDYKKGAGDYDPGSKMLAPIISASNSVGKPWGIAELGGALLNSDPSGTGRAAWLDALLKIAESNHALWTTYFDLDWQNGAYDYRIRDAATKNVWNNFCNGHP